MTSNDAAVFNTGSDDCDLTTNVTVGSLSVTAGYTGNLTQNDGSLTISGNLASAGKFLGGTSQISVGGDLSVSAGTFRSTSGLLDIGGACNLTGGTFTHHSGRVVLKSSASKTFASNGATFNNLIISDGLVGYWKLDETAVGTAVDSSGYGNNGVHLNTPTLSTTVPSAIKLSDPRSLQVAAASRQAVQIAAIPAVLKPSTLTLSLWYSSTAVDAAGGEDLISAGDQYALRAGSTQVSIFKRISGNWVAVAYTVPGAAHLNGSWHHLAGTISATTMTLYFDGVSVATAADANAIVYDQGSDLFIGRHGNGSPDFDVDGYLDDVRVYNRVLSGAEIAAIYAAGQPNTSTATQTLTGSPIISGDLTIGSGTLAIGTNSLTIGGSFWNYGGAFTTGASGGVTFNGSGSSNQILASGSTFRDLTVSGTGSWTISDTGTVTLGGSFGQSAGTFVSTAGLLNVGGAFNKTGGTFTHNSGKVMLTSTASQTFASNGATFNNLTINDGLVGYWKLDDATGTAAVDSSGYGNDGTLVQGPAWITAAASLPTLSFSDPAGLSFDGVNDYVTLGYSNLPAANAAQTISVWVKATATASTQDFIALLGPSSGVQLGIRQVASVWSIVAWKNGGTTLVSSPAGSFAGSWHHVAYTFDGTTHSLYVDGATPVTSTVAPQAAAVNYARLGDSGSAFEPFAGTLDEVRVYKRTLSAAEIAALAAGNQPASSVATQTLTGNPTVAGDLVIASGTLAAGTTSLTIGGSWRNYGGLFTAGSTGLVTFNGSSAGSVIRSARQRFGGVTVNGSGTWTLEDRLEVNPGSTLTLTGGTLSASSYALRAGNLARTSGTLSAGTGKVVLGGSASATFGGGSFNDLRVEPVAVTNLVGYWKMDAGQGAVAHDFSSGGHDATLMNGTRWTASSLPSSISFDNPAALSLDGVSNYLDTGANVTASTSPLSYCAWVKLNTASTAIWEDIVSVDGVVNGALSLDKRGDNNTFSFTGISTDTTNSALVTTGGNTTPTFGTWYHLCGTYDGTYLRLYVNGVQDGAAVAFTPFSATGHTIIGGVKWNGAYIDPVNGFIDDVRIYNVALSAAQVAALAAGRYPSGLAGAPTYTLGASTTVSGTFALDAGTLATSSFTMNASSGSAVATINSGTYTVGSTSSTFAGGLTVTKDGTVGLATTGGSVAIGSAKTLTIDGTLNASNTGATIQSSSGFYAFKVGSTSTATPTLNISGLAVKNTDTNGMYVNAVAGATTTFTQFDNIAFSSGTGARLLQIYAPTLFLLSNGCTFDSGASSGTTTKNVTLRGDGNSGTATETRALFGNATCLNGGNYAVCEANDDDDDAGADGIGDTAASNAAVIQWVHAAQSDTSGTIEGFPTAAFDWSTFTYYSTYVTYHDVAGGTADRIYVRNTNGTALYSWDSPSGVDLVGSPRFDTVSGTHYVYVATTTGKVYRLIDNGTSSLAQDNSGNWAGSNNPYDCSCTIATPLTIDGTNIYWGGVAAAANKIWTLGKSNRTLASSSPMTTGLAVALAAAAPAIWVDSTPHTQIFMGSAAHFYKVDINAQTLTTDNILPTGTVNGRISIISGKVYGADSTGKLWVLDAASFGSAALWSYHDDTNHNGCTSGVCAITGSLYVDAVLGRAYYGDGDGHLYASYNSSGTTGAQITAGYPIRPGSSADVFASAPLYTSGILVAGTTTGSVYVIDVNGGSGPVLKQTYKLGASTKISGIGFDRGSQSYMVSAADASAKDGKLIYIDAMADPTPGSN